MTTSRCPSCGLPARPMTRPRRVRRGSREVTFDALYWACPKGDPAPEGDGVFTFLDRQAAAENRARLDAAWRDRYGEAAPPPRRPGPPATQDQRLQVRMPQELVDKLDNLTSSRGSTRSEVVRELVETATAAASGHVSSGMQVWVTRYRRTHPRRTVPPLLSRKAA